jgi:hypothetical protein
MPDRHKSITRINRSVISGRANPAFIPGRRLTPTGLAGGNSRLPWQATSPLFQSPLGAPFGPSDGLLWLIALTKPTMPSADSSTVFSRRFQRPSFDLLKRRGDIPEQGTLPSLHRRRIYKTHPTTADGGLRSHVPARPGCITPHIRFLFIAPQFRIELPSDPASRRRLCPSPCLRLCKTWPSDFHRRSNAPCPAHTWKSPATRLYRAASPGPQGWPAWRMGARVLIHTGLCNWVSSFRAS